MRFLSLLLKPQCLNNAQLCLLAKKEETPLGPVWQGSERDGFLLKSSSSATPNSSQLTVLSSVSKKKCICYLGCSSTSPLKALEKAACSCELQFNFLPSKSQSRPFSMNPSLKLSFTHGGKWAGSVSVVARLACSKGINQLQNSQSFKLLCTSKISISSVLELLKNDVLETMP